MTTKYDIGDVVMIPAKVRRIKIDHDKTVFYELVEVANNCLNDTPTVPEKDIIDTLAVYDERKCQKIPLGLLDKRIDLIKQLREANGFTYDEISMIMNMDEDIVRTILSDNES